MSIQLPFDFAYQTAQGADDFVISDSNTEAVQWLDRYPNWGAPGLIISGPDGSGKTHLAQIWQHKIGANYAANVDDLTHVLESGSVKPLVIDNANSLALQAEEPVFHLYNRAMNSGSHILFCSTKPLAGWDIKLPDLKSRLGALPQAQIGQADDTLLLGLFVRQLAARGVTLKMELVEYALNRLPRSPAEVIDTANRLDQYALQHGRTFNQAMLREFFAAEAASS